MESFTKPLEPGEGFGNGEGERPEGAWARENGYYFVQQRLQTFKDILDYQIGFVSDIERLEDDIISNAVVRVLGHTLEAFKGCIDDIEMLNEYYSKLFAISDLRQKAKSERKSGTAPVLANIGNYFNTHLGVGGMKVIGEMNFNKGTDFTADDDNGRDTSKN